MSKVKLSDIVTTTGTQGQGALIQADGSLAYQNVINSLSAGTTGLTLTSTFGSVVMGGTLSIANGGTGATTQSGARTALGLEIGVNVQGYSGVLAAYAGGDMPSGFTLGIVDGADASAWRTSLGLGGSAVLNVGTAAGTVAAGDDSRITGALQRGGGTMTGALTLAADPTGALQAATKQYVDNVAAGLDVKGSCRAATTANITLSGLQTIDTVSLVAGDRVLVKNQTAPAQNGIYVVASGAWTRATDMDTWAECPGADTYVEEGTLAGRKYTCTVAAGGTIGTTAITWTQTGGTGSYQAVSSNLNAIAGQTTAADQVTYWTGNATAAQTTLTSFARTLLDDVDAATMRTTLALGTAAVENMGTSGHVVPYMDGTNTWGGTQTFGNVVISMGSANLLPMTRTGSNINAVGSFSTALGTIYFGNADGTGFAIGSTANLNSPGARWLYITSSGITTGTITATGGSITGLTTLTFADATAQSNARTAMGVAIGTDVQAYNVKLQAMASLTVAADQLIYWNSATTCAATAITSQGRTFLAATDQAGQRSALGLGSMALQAATDYIPLTGTTSLQGDLTPSTNNSRSLGTTSFRYAGIYSVLANFGGSGGNRTITIEADAGSSAYLQMNASTVRRWLFGRNSSAESTGNAGSNFTLVAYADDGSTVIGTSLSIRRSDLQMTMGGSVIPTTSNTLTLGSGTNVWAAAYVADDPYAVGWDGSFAVPTKNAVYDKIEALLLEQSLKDGFRFNSLVAPSGLINFARPSGAPYRDSSGVIQTAAMGNPRFTYRWDGTAWVPGGLMMEPSTTNIVVYSDDLTNAYWTKTGMTPSVGSKSYDGTNMMYLLTTTSTTQIFRITSAWSVTAGASVATSVYVAVPTTTPAAWLRFVLSDAVGGGNGWQVWFDPNTGTVGNISTQGSGWSVGTVTVNVLPNGVYRLNFVHTQVGTALSLRVSATGVNGSGSAISGVAFMIGGIQVEDAKTRATSLVKTAGSSLSRSAESADLDWSRTRFRPNGAMSLRFQFGDGSSQTLAATAASGVTAIPVASLNGSTIKYVSDMTAV